MIQVFAVILQWPKPKHIACRTVVCKKSTKRTYTDNVCTFSLQCMMDGPSAICNQSITHFLCAKLSIGCCMMPVYLHMGGIYC